MNPRNIDLVITRWYARFMGKVIPCAIGKAGMTTKQKEGDNITPLGTWSIKYGYYRCDRHTCPDSLIPFYATGFTGGWSDDVRDTAYNTPVILPHRYSAERLCRADPVYDYVLVLDYNTDPVRIGKGSAVFLHCWRKPRHPTAGCVAFAPQDLRWICENWQPQSKVVIGADI